MGGGPDIVRACNGGPGIVRNVPNPALNTLIGGLPKTMTPFCSIKNILSMVLRTTSR